MKQARVPDAEELCVGSRERQAGREARDLTEGVLGAGGHEAGHGVESRWGSQWAVALSR